MLMGFTNVDKEGNFEIIGDLRVLYSVMMTIRANIVDLMGATTLIGTLIAARYSAVRRQFKTYNGNKMERRIIDYQTQYLRIGKLMSQGFVMHFSGAWVTDQFFKMLDDIKQSNFDRMDVVHHLLAGFKSTYSG